MEIGIRDIISIIAIFLSPLIAVIIGELIRKKSFIEQRKLEVLNDLMAYRHKVNSPEFLKALNSLKLFFNKGELKESLDSLHEALSLRDKGQISPEKVDSLIVEIIQEVCRLNGFKNISRQDIKRLFKAT